MITLTFGDIELAHLADSKVDELEDGVIMFSFLYGFYPTDVKKPAAYYFLTVAEVQAKLDELAALRGVFLCQLNLDSVLQETAGRIEAARVSVSRFEAATSRLGPS